MRAIPPLTLKDHYYAAVEVEIRRIFYEIMYRPLVEILDVNPKILQNTKSPLVDAIASGRVWYEDGQFKGKFNAATSAAIIKLGGKFNPAARTYSLPQERVPVDIQFAQADARLRYEAMQAQMLTALDNMNPKNVDHMSRIKEEYERTITHMDADLHKTLPPIIGPKISNPSGAVSRITIEAKLSDDQKRIISSEWGKNLDLYIQDWTEQNILKLREEIQPAILAGERSESLVKAIQDNYGVSARKAKFLARQETALLMSKFQETRYKDIGIEKYRWSTAHDKRVRHDHHQLNGKVFNFSQPPITNRKTGARNNPGGDYNCRCVAIPLVE